MVTIILIILFKSDRHPEEALVVEEATGKSNASSDEPVEVYHYIAYVPVDGEVWQLDGLYPHPISVGRLTIYTF